MWLATSCVGQRGGGYVVGILLLWITPRCCGGVDGPEMYQLLSGSGVVCVEGLVKGNDVPVLIGCMCCLLCLYLQPWASMI